MAGSSKDDAAIESASGLDPQVSNLDIVAASVHLTATAAVDLRSQRASLAAVIETMKNSRQCVADPWRCCVLRDGIYLLWKAPTTAKRIRGTCHGHYWEFGDYPFVFHKKEWTGLGPGSAWSEAVAAEAVGATQPPIRDDPGEQPQGPRVNMQPRPSMIFDLRTAARSPRADLALRKRSLDYILGAELGSGTYGQVFLATRGEQSVAVKRFRTLDNIAVATEEAYVFELCAGHPNIVALLDVFAGPAACGQRAFHLVLENFGTDLAVRFNSSPESFVPCIVRSIASSFLLWCICMRYSFSSMRMSSLRTV